MQQWLNISEASAYLGLSERAIYKRIEKGQMAARKVNGKREVKVTIDEPDSQNFTKVQEKNLKAEIERLGTQVELLGNENEHLRTENDRLIQIVAMGHKNIERLTVQIEKKDMLLEDKRRNWWQRLFRRSIPSITQNPYI